ncbi:MAG: hypothetical protein ACXQTN_01655 [Methanoculleaceae archaeon]
MRSGARPISASADRDTVWTRYPDPSLISSAGNALPDCTLCPAIHSSSWSTGPAISARCYRRTIPAPAAVPAMIAAAAMITARQVSGTFCPMVCRWGEPVFNCHGSLWGIVEGDTGRIEMEID